jgi:monofunctional biosynthetic peptidoglycan transglycosylase
MIAACLPNPKKYSVKPLSNYVAKRSGWVGGQMNFIEKDEDVQKIIK